MKPMLSLRPSYLSRRYHNLNDIWAPPSTAPPPHTPSPPRRPRPAEQAPVLLAENRCAHIKTWDFLRNPAEALTLIRAVEQAYGPVESFRFQKDFDNSQLYQVVVKVNFRDIASFHRIPASSETFHIRAPKVEQKRPGGIGLDEINQVFSHDGKIEFLTADQVTEMGPEGTIDFRIERAKRAYYEESPYRFTGSNHKYRKVVGTRMLEWGGFHKMNPIDSTTPITDEDLTSVALDHVHMRRALREWATYLHVRNPFETYPAEKSETGDGTRKPEVNATEVIKVEQSEQTQPEPTPEEWVPLETGVSRTIKEPFDEMIGLVDTKAAPGAVTEPSEPLIEDILIDSASPSPSLELEETIVSATQTTAEPTPATAETSISAPTVPPSPQPHPASSDLPSLQNSNPTPLASETTRTHLPSNSHPPPRPMSQPSKPKVDQQKLQSQLEEARRIAATIRSFEKKKVASRENEQAERVVQEKQQEKPAVLRETEEESVVEVNPRFSGLLSRLQNVFKS